MIILFDAKRVDKKSDRIELLFGKRIDFRERFIFNKIVDLDRPKGDLIFDFPEDQINRFYFGSYVSYQLAVEKDLTFSDVFHFGSTLVSDMVVLPSLEISDTFHFGSTLTYELDVRQLTEFYFGSHLTYELTIPLEFPGKFTFGFGSTLVWHQRPEPTILRDSKFSFGSYLSYDANILNFNIQRSCIEPDPETPNDITFDRDRVNNGIVPTTDMCIRFKSDLSVRQSLPKTYFYFGSNLVLKEHYDDPSYKFYFGSSMRYQLDGEITHNLCYGNFIEDGNNVILEFTDPRKQCQSYNFYFGSALKYELSTFEGMGSAFFFGSMLKANMSVYNPYMSSRFYFGSFLTGILSGLTPFLSAKFYFGSTLKSSMYEPPILFYFGSYLTGDIKVKYELVFTESGCLPNEYIPVDDDGFPIEFLIRREAVEEDYFIHNIKIGCYR